MERIRVSSSHHTGCHGAQTTAAPPIVPSRLQDSGGVLEYSRACEWLSFHLETVFLITCAARPPTLLYCLKVLVVVHAAFMTLATLRHFFVVSTDRMY